jgi:hypothetical protein
MDLESKKSPSSSPQKRKVRKITSTLENLFQRADFINNAKEDDKICFKTHIYVNKNSWYGAFIRHKDGETSEDTVRKISDVSKELSDQADMCIDTQFRDMILSKLIKLRTTCVMLRDSTYVGEMNFFTNINTIISRIEIGLPSDILESNGISKLGSDLHKITAFSPAKIPNFHVPLVPQDIVESISVSQFCAGVEVKESEESEDSEENKNGSVSSTSDPIEIIKKKKKKK